MISHDSSSSFCLGARRSPPSAILVALQPLAIATTQIFWFYAQNTGEFDFPDVYRSLLVVGGASLIVWALASATLRDARRGALFASVVALLFWSSTSIGGAATAIGGHILSAIVVGGLWIVGVPVLFAWLARSTRSLKGAHWVFDVVAAAGLAVPLVSIVIAGGGGRSLDDPLAVLEQKGAAGETGGRPDIYLIVLDAHGRDDELAEHFGIDTGLGDELEKLGFYVARQSHANYSSTLHALPSLLNFEFIPQLVKRPTGAKLTILFRRNRFVRFLRSHGYRFISYASGINLTECEAADVYIEPPAHLELLGGTLRPNHFERGLLPWTPFEAALRQSDVLSPYAQHRERILHAISDLPRHADDPDRTFVFAHILSPHEPFVFGENGEDVSPYEVSFALNRIFEDPDQPAEPGRVGPEYARRYRAQTSHIDRLVLQTVEEILRRSPEPPIIIILGDHGPYGFSPNTRDPSFPILSAFHLPNGGEKWLYPSITPVNSLRVVLNHYFHRRLPMLPDKSYRTDWSKPDVYTPVVTRSFPIR